MPFNMGPIEMFFVLALTLFVWGLPILIVIWLIRTINGIHASVRRIEARLYDHPE